MQTFDNLLALAHKIDAGIRDSETRQANLKPLWDHPLIREAFIAMLSHSSEHYRTNFEIIAGLLCPGFVDVAYRLCKQGDRGTSQYPGLDANCL